MSGKQEADRTGAHTNAAPRGAPVRRTPQEDEYARKVAEVLATARVRVVLGV